MNDTKLFANFIILIPFWKQLDFIKILPVQFLQRLSEYNKNYRFQ